MPTRKLVPQSVMATDVSLQEIDAGANACSVEYCPVPGLEAYVACSTYVLETSRCGGHQHEGSNLETEKIGSTPVDAEDDAHPGAATATGASTSHATSTSYADTEGGNSVVGQTRTGTVAIYRTVSVQPQSTDEAVSVERQDLALERAGRAVLDGGVLDAKWAEKEMHDGAAALACATSTGRLCLYTLEHAGSDADLSAVRKHAELKHLTSSAERNCLLLSLDWSGGDIEQAKNSLIVTAMKNIAPLLAACNQQSTASLAWNTLGMPESQMVVSQSDGQLAIWRPNPSGDALVEEVGPWPGHQLRGGVATEAWISFFRKGEGVHDASLVISGAEDALMKGWDLRAGDSRGVLPAFVSKGHGAGVTAGQWHPWHEHIFASGSYDENVRIWDVRAVRCPVSTFPTGGGVWRLKWHPLPDRGDILLAACMHAGVRVLDVSSSTSSSVVRGRAEGETTGIIAKYTRHASMAYGVDWCRLTPSLNARTPVVASCSFYDNLLCLWRTPPL